MKMKRSIPIFRNMKPNLSTFVGVNEAQYFQSFIRIDICVNNSHASHTNEFIG